MLLSGIHVFPLDARQKHSGMTGLKRDLILNTLRSYSFLLIRIPERLSSQCNQIADYTDFRITQKKHKIDTNNAIRHAHSVLRNQRNHYDLR